MLGQSNERNLQVRNRYVNEPNNTSLYELNGLKPSLETGHTAVDVFRQAIFLTTIQEQ